MQLYAAIFLATFSTLLVPLPEEAALLGAGYAARLGRVTLPGAMAAAWSAVLIGDSLSYWAGRGLLARVLGTRLGRRYFPPRWREWGERLVRDHGVRAIVVARFLVGLRGFVYLAVGASKYPFGRFFAVDAAVGIAEVGGLVAAGFAFGELRAKVGRDIDLAAAAVLLAVLFGPLVVRRRFGRAAKGPRSRRGVDQPPR
ncbi:MAG TPA: DedA family protein [Polyangiaceae bacterium]|nr:DedA family protein [Polyangiaceae bacterium]